MKTLLITLLLSISIFGQSKLLLLMGDDAPVQKLTITANTANYKIDDGSGAYYFQVAGTAGKKFKVDWGDGTTSEITFTGATTNQRIAKTYASAGTYNVKMWGWDDVTQLRWQNWNAGAFNLQSLPTGLTYLILNGLGTNLTGSISSLPTGLTFLSLNVLGTNLTGSISSLPTGLTYLYLNNLGTNLTGSISSLRANITVLTLNLVGNNIDITTGTMPTWGVNTITITPQTSYGYTTAQIDSFLISWATTAASGTKTIDLRGANQPRSSASDAAVATLTGLGKTILTNP